MNKYGEPWVPTPYDLTATTADKWVAISAATELYRDRAIECVNACAGIENPAEVIRDVREWLITFHENLTSAGHTASAHLLEKFIRKLTP